ncbi:MAG TPA: glycosyltransferase family 1 protein [Steroidobacteraceae bacterium]|jgi:glycosyltransferase involved in cell wall biosynthesis|nr:glycosyltransferase family 1 protein [Steroidobacteraceae bacterium]
MRIMIVTDAWFPQTNGVVSTLAQTAAWLGRFGHEVRMITPRDFRSVACPTYPEIRLSLWPYQGVERAVLGFQPQALHIATEGPLGIAARRYCLRNGVRFTTSYHTQFPQYLRARAPIPLGVSYRALRWFHSACVRCMVSTASLRAELAERGFRNLASWRRGVDTELFLPRDKSFLALPRPLAAYVGRVAVEKNVEAFLDMEWAGGKIVIGDGPERARLERRYPQIKFAGYRFGDDLAQHLAAADVMVFPSRTDTFGLVNLEAMACGVPVAAYPVTGPIDVIEEGVTGALDEDLATAARRALGVHPQGCRERALRSGWDVCSREFEGNLERFEPPNQPKLILASRLVRESAVDNASSSSIFPSRTRL